MCQSLVRCQYCVHMRARTLLPLTALCALIAAGFTGWSCGTTSVHSGSACARARIGDRTVCLQPNVRCERSHEGVYRSYGLTCVLSSNGYRLQQRSYIGPPNP
jgi:hypothetical protein